MNQVFPNDQYMLQNHIWVKDPCKMQCRPTDSVSHVWKINWSCFGFHIATNLCVVSKRLSETRLKRPLKCWFLFQQRICVRPDFLHILQADNPLQQVERRSSYENPASVKPGDKQIGRSIRQCHSFLWIFWKLKVCYSC